MPQNERRHSEKGQILLIVVLASVVSLTVGLAAISRSITNNRVSTEESNSQKALSAAEAGVEEQINRINTTQGGTVNLNPPPKDLSNNSKVDTVAKELKGALVEINGGQPITRDEGVDVWLSEYPDFSSPITSTITVFWNAADANCQNVPVPAIEIAVISGDTANPRMERYAVDSCAVRQAQNGFENDSSTGPAFPTGYNQRFNFNVVGGRIARIIPLYANAKIAVASSPQDLPAQGYEIDSTGQAGTTVRKVRVYQGFPRLPVEFFPYNLFLP
jgi:hypothetical protein